MNGPYVPIEDLAQHFSVSVSTIRGWIRRNQIPKHTYIRVGNTYRFSIDDVSVALSAPKLEKKHGKKQKLKKQKGWKNWTNLMNLMNLLVIYLKGILQVL